MENHGKYGEFIYTPKSDSLYVNLFIASELNWRDKGVSVKQSTAFPDESLSRLTIDVEKPTQFTLLVRYPSWVAQGEMKVICKGRNYATEATPSSYVAITRKWRKGDVVEIETPMSFRLEELPNVKSYVSIMRGPIVFGVRAGDDDLRGLIADDGRWAHIAHGELISIFDAPALIGEREEIIDKLNRLQRADNGQFAFDASPLFTSSSQVLLEPFSGIHDSRYSIYWLCATEQEHTEMVASRQASERERLTLDRRTIDALKCGEQQPEADHRIKSDNSHTGIHLEESWRDVSNGGFFQVQMNSGGRADITLMVRY